MFLSMDQLEKQLDKEEFQEIGSMASFKYFLEYTQLEIPEFRDTLIQHMESVKKSIDERAQHKREYDSRVNERQMHTIEEKVDMSNALDASLVDTKSSGTESGEQDTRSRSGNDAHADDADIKPVYDKEPMAEVQLTAENNVFATGQQHTEQPEFNNEGEVDQNAEQYHDICPLPAKLTHNPTTELSNQSLDFLTNGCQILNQGTTSGIEPFEGLWRKKISLDHKNTGAALKITKQIDSSKPTGYIKYQIPKSEDGGMENSQDGFISTGNDGIVRVLSPVTAAEIQAIWEAIRKWEAIRTRFGGNANSKKMQKAVFKQQFEAFKISNSEGLEKGYDRFQQLLSQLEAHGAEVSTEDANHKFLRSLPPAWSNLAMTMRTNPEIDTLSIDDLYNNLRVFEQEIQGASKTSSSAQNVAFVSQSKSSTNKVKSGFSGAYSTCTPSTSSTNIPEKEVLAGFADEVIYSLFAKQTEDLDLLHEDLEQIDDVDIEEMDINWQIAMIAIRMKKFYKKTGRRVRVDGKTPVGFDKKKLECFNCHNTGHFARECTAKGTYDGKKKSESLYQQQEAGKQEKNQMGLLTMDDGLKLLYDEQMSQLGDQEAQILAYTQAVKKLEAQLVTFQKQQLSLNEKLTFQANEIYEKDEKLKRYRRIGMKAVKEKEQLQKTLDSWKDSFKNLWRLINSGMSSNSKVGLGFEIQSNNEVLSYMEEMNFSVFNCSKEDSVGKPLYSRFTKTNDFKGVPHPLSGDYTPTPQEEIDESLYVYGKKGPQEPEPNVSDDRSSEYSTCQSNDKVYMFTPKTTNEKGVSDPKSKEVEPSCVSHIKTPRQPIKDQATPKVNRKNWNAMMERELGEGYSFTKKKCFVCGSLSHLIKDCDYYEKKMAREAEVKKQRVFNTDQYKVQLNAGRPNINSVRPNINTGRTNINSVRPNINTRRTNVNPVRPRVNTGSSNVNTGNWGSAVKTSAGYNWRNSKPNSNCDSGPTFIRTVNAKGSSMKNLVEKRLLFDSGCSGHMTGNKDQLEDFEEFNGGSVTFGGSKGYISGKGKIRVGNLDFDSVSFVKELGHFNLFSISQICDKQHKVLFTETEYLVVSSDFKMPDENQILLN
ncbi:ribonuclease H-like domain-containing protein [Tanacetum coccineum]